MDTQEAVAHRIRQLCREQDITPNKLSKISAVPQATIKSILLGESKNPGTVAIKRLCDVEMQTADKSLGWLPKRTRYYQAMIDLNVLGKGKDYIELKKSFVIFICTFDPFPGNDRKMYTFTNLCMPRAGWFRAW